MTASRARTIWRPDRTSDLEAMKRWAGMLRATCRGVVDDLFEGDRAGQIESFADELGHRRLVDRPLLANLLGICAGEVPTKMSGDVSLWWAIHDSTIDFDSVLLASDGGPGPLLVDKPTGSIEIWTEEELSSLHALWHLAMGRNRRDLMERALEAARWHVAELQPDNATNHPWAIHVFVALWLIDGDDAAHLHAQTLLNNCQVQMGRPDRFCACVLLDAAVCLEGDV